MKVRIRVGREHLIGLFVLLFLLFGVRLMGFAPGLTGAIVLPPSGNLSCQFVELGNFSCPAGFTKMYGMSAQENAHAERFNESSYNVSVCCQDLAAANTIGTGSDGTGFMNISNFTNAHVELTTAGFYDVPLFVNASNASIGCSVNMTGEGSCPSGFACMGTLSNDTNAHVSNCTSAGRYNITVCCSIGALITVYRHPNTAPTNNLTANGSTNGTLVDTTETSYETQDILFFNASDNDKRFFFIRGQFNLSDVDARPVTVEFNQSAVAVNLTGLTGDTDNHTVYLANNSNNLGLHLCPGAQTLAEIVPSCTGEINFTGPFPQTIGQATVLIDGSDFRVENLNGSGVELLFAINASLTNTSLDNSTAQDSVLVDSNASNSSVSGSSSKLNVTMINSTNINSSISFAIEIDTVLTVVNASNCRFEQTTIAQSSCLNSIMIQDTGVGWEVDPSNVTNSSCAGVCNVTDSNVTNSALSNAIINNSNLTNSNATGSELHNSTVDFSNIVGLIVLNANITNQFCFYGTIIQGLTVFNCPIALSSIYFPAGGGGGGGGSGAGAGAAAGAAASAASSTSSAAAAAASASAKASVSVQAAVSTAGLGQCQTVVPKLTSERPDIPRGYELLGKPDFTCFGQVADFTINIPNEYEDLKALRCRAGVCKEVEETNRASDQLMCGSETVRNLREQELSQLRPQVTIEVPIEVGADRYFSEANRRTFIGPFEAELRGPLPPRFVGRLHLAGGEVPLPPNPQVILLNPPLQIDVGDAHPLIWLNISVPTVSGIDVGTLTAAVYRRGQWVLLGGEYDAATDSVKILLEDVGEHIEDGKLVVGLLGVVCEACTQGELVRDYSDGSSRRALILVHGLTAHAMKFGSMIDDFRLTSQPWQVWTFRYPYNNSIEQDAKELRDLIALHNEEFDEVYLLGHSLGGLVVQQALSDAYADRQQGGDSSAWLDEVRRAIIIGTPNRGSPTADVYREILNNLFNLSTTASPFDVQSSIIGDLAYGRSIPPVPGIDYQVIVGTRAIPFTDKLFEGQTNDGVLTPESGSTLGDVAFRDSCEDYYAINVTHVDLDDHPTAIRVVQRILNEELAERDPSIALIGYNQYLRVRVEDCSPSDSYFIIGKPIEEQQTFDPILCECGNKYCNEGESPENCPSDCARISLLTQSCVGLLFSAYPLILLTALLLMWRYGLRLLRRSGGRASRGALWVSSGALACVAALQPFACGGPQLVISLAGAGFLLLTVLDSLPRRGLAGESSSGYVPPPSGQQPPATGYKPLATNQQPRAYIPLPAPKETFAERVESLRQRWKRRVAYWKEARRLNQLAKQADFRIGDGRKVDKMIENLPDEVKRKLKRKR